MPLILQFMRQQSSGKSILKWTVLALTLWMAGCRQPEAPEYYGFQNVQIGKSPDGQTTLATTVKMYNPNHYSLQLKRAEVDVALNGHHAGHSLLDTTILIPQQDTFYVPVAMQIDLRNIFSNALQMLIDKQVTVSLDGRVKIKRGMFTFNRPFHYDGKQDLNSLLPSGGGF
jgi:LEA14-like dessication related protein